MKNINIFKSEKYNSPEYTEVEKDIYKTVDCSEQSEDCQALDDESKTIYVVSLSFVQEPELNEGEDSSDISQYPLEDILDEFFCYITDDYPELNEGGSEICYLEFGSDDIEDVRNLKTIVGKHVYDKEIDDYVELVIE